MTFFRTSMSGRLRGSTTALKIGLSVLVSSVGFSAAAPVTAVPIRSALALIPDIPVPEMGDYPAADFVEQAKELPVALAVALDRDLQLTPAEYLAAAAAAIDAGAVVSALRDGGGGGVAVLGSRLEGTTLVVNVASASDVAVAESAGAVGELGEPPHESIRGLEFQSAATTAYGGTGYYLNGYQCSIGFNGFRTSDASRQALTAGHCLESATPQDAVYPMDPSHPGIGPDVDFSAPIAYPFSRAFGSGYDSGILSFAAGVDGPPAIVTWGGSRAAALSSSPMAIRGQIEAVVGANLCKSGSRTGWTCGKVMAVDQSIVVSGGLVINSILATTCILPGDSGGAAVIGQFAAGLNSTTSNVDSCASEDYRSGFFPLVSSKASVQKKYGSTWELAVSAARPVITAPGASGSINAMDALAGTLPDATKGSRVVLYIDRGTRPLRTVDASSGRWSIPLSEVSAGSHEIRIKTVWGTLSVSQALTRTITVTPPLLAMTAAKPVISGVPRAGTTLRVTPGAYTPAATSYHYQWKADGSTVGSDASSFTLGPAQIGKRITVTVIGTRPDSRSAGETSVATPVVVIASMGVPQPKISGQRNVGQRLTAKPGTWIPANRTLSYQWYRGSVKIPGATSASYLQGRADRGKVINVQITGRAAGYVTTSRKSAARTKTAIPVLKANTPGIKGTARVGHTLTGLVGVWGPKPVKLSYQWKVDGVRAKGATGKTFTIPPAAADKVITFTVTAKKSNFIGATRTSAATARVSPLHFSRVPEARISGTAEVGSTLTVATGVNWAPQPTELHYRWFRDGKPISGATGRSYILVIADSGSEIGVRIFASKPGYAVERIYTPYYSIP